MPTEENFFTMLAGAFERAKETKDSIYDANTPKVANLKLNNDSNALGYAVFIDKEILGMDLSSQQKSDVFQNTLIVQLIQMCMLGCVWKFELQYKDNTEE